MGVNCQCPKSPPKRHAIQLSMSRFSRSHYGQTSCNASNSFKWSLEQLRLQDVYLRQSEGIRNLNPYALNILKSNFHVVGVAFCCLGTPQSVPMAAGCFSARRSTNVSYMPAHWGSVRACLRRVRASDIVAAHSSIPHAFTSLEVQVVAHVENFSICWVHNAECQG